MNNSKYLLGALGLLLFLASCTDKQKESQKYTREASIYLFKSQVYEARRLYEKATELDPNNEEAWHGQGITWMNVKKYQKAIEYFDKAIALNPEYMDAYYNRGQAWFYMGDRFAACDDWQIAFDLGKPNMQEKLRKCE